MENKVISVKILAAAAVGAVLMYLLNHFATIPTSVAGTNFMPGMAVLAAVAAIFGPAAGFLAGFIGHFLVDLTGDFGRIWWSYVIASALFGLAVGYFRKMYRIEEGRFGVKEALIFNGVQAIANILAYFFIARTLSMIMFKESFGTITMMGIVAAGINIPVILVLGTLLIIVYIKFKNRSGKAKGK